MKSKPKSCVLDPVPTAVLKQAQEVFERPLTDIINASFQTDVFPTVLKKGVVRPLLKKLRRDYKQYSSYRPITNITFLSKIIECLATSQTMNYLVDNGLLPKFQSAYRLHHSTETALVCVFNDILKTIDKHQDIVLVLLDLSSAFDTKLITEHYWQDSVIAMGLMGQFFYGLNCTSLNGLNKLSLRTLNHLNCLFLMGSHKG